MTIDFVKVYILQENQMQLRSGRIIECTVVIRNVRNVRNVRNQRKIINHINKERKQTKKNNFFVSFLSGIILSILCFIRNIISLCLSILEFISIALIFFYAIELCNELSIIYQDVLFMKCINNSN